MSSQLKLPRWDDLRLVIAISQAGTLAQAAKLLNVNASTAFRKLQKLEATLKSPLFVRTRTRYELTSAGAELVELARRVDNELSMVLRTITKDEPQRSGEILVTTNDTLLFHVLMPIFARFYKLNPKVRIKVTIDNEALNLTKRDADVAIRSTNAPPENLVGRRIARTAWAIYGSADGYDKRGAIASAELKKEMWVTLTGNLSDLNVTRFVAETIAPDRIAFVVNSVQALADAIEAGFGIGPLPCFVADLRPRLVRLHGPIASFSHELWLLTHPAVRRSPLVSSFVTFVTAELVKHRNLFEGVRAP